MRDRNLLREREASDNAPSARAPQTPAISGVDRSLCIKGHPADQPRRLRPGHGLVHRVEACSQDVARVQALTAHGVRIADRCLRRLCTGLLPEPRFLPTRGKPQPQRSDVTSGHRHAHAFGAGGWAPNAWSASCRKADADAGPTSPANRTPAITPGPCAALRRTARTRRRSAARRKAPSARNAP